MTEKEIQADKELLLKDISARLPYRVLGQCEIDTSYDTEFETIPQTHKFKAVATGFNEDSLFVCPMIENQDELEIANEEIGDGVYILDFKPYLFPLSSMTDEEQRTLDSMCNGVEMVSRLSGLKMFDKAFNWLDENHFDYRGLIEKGLAIDATGKKIY